MAERPVHQVAPVAQIAPTQTVKVAAINPVVSWDENISEATALAVFGGVWWCLVVFAILTAIKRSLSEVINNNNLNI